VLLLEDEPSFCLREGKVWKLKEVDLQKNQGMIVASREPREGGESAVAEEKLTFDSATRIWRGRECLMVADLVSEGVWPTEGKKSLAGQTVQRRVACSYGTTSQTSGWMILPCSAPLKNSVRPTRR
jgi:hypothetical protein